MDYKQPKPSMMPDLYWLILVGIVILCFCGVTEYFSSGYEFVQKVLDAKEYNRNEFGVSTGTQCKKQCSNESRCRATEFILENNDAGSACVFYDQFSGSVKSKRAPGNQVSGVWIKST